MRFHRKCQYKLNKAFCYKFYCVLTTILVTSTFSVVGNNLASNNKTREKGISRSLANLAPRITQKVEPTKLPHHVFVFKLYGNVYRAFCAGSIISEMRVLSAASCYLTHRKRYKLKISTTRVAAGAVLETLQRYPEQNTATKQWRSIRIVHSQKFFRYPMYNIAVVVLKEKFEFNDHVNKIPIASLNQNFNGVCSTVAIKPRTSWASIKRLYKQEFHLIDTKKCENLLLRPVSLFYCIINKEHAQAYTDIEGSGLICHRTGDPEELVEDTGVLVGVSSCTNLNLPSLYTRVALFNKWIRDDCSSLGPSKLIEWMCLIIFLSKLF